MTAARGILDLSDLILGDPDALWLGQQARRAGVADTVRQLVPDGMAGPYDAGVALGESVRAVASMSESDRRRVLRMLRALGATQEEKAPPGALPVTIAAMRQRLDVGTDTRYDLDLVTSTGRAVTVRDLRASDVLTYERLRPVVMDAGAVLGAMPKGRGSAWVEEVQRAMDAGTIEALAADYSEAGEIKELLADLSGAATRWEWSADDPYPHGIRRIEWVGGLVGYPRGAMREELRRRLGRVSRVALARAVDSLGWTARDWVNERGHLRVWGGLAEVAK